MASDEEYSPFTDDEEGEEEQEDNYDFYATDDDMDVMMFNEGGISGSGMNSGGIAGGDEFGVKLSNMNDNIHNNNNINHHPSSSIGSNRDYEVEYRVLALNDITLQQTKEIDQISSVLGLSKWLCELLLRSFRWNKEKLLEKYMEDMDKVLAETLGLDKNNKNNNNNNNEEEEDQDQEEVVQKLKDGGEKIVKENFFCNICCNEGDLETFSLSCGHCFCISCYGRFVTQKISDDGDCRNIRCPGDCRRLLDDKSIETLVKPEIYKKYHNLLMRSYVDDMDYLKWCPAPNCQYAVECHVRSSRCDRIVPSVECKCGYSFCFNCCLQSHQPIPCFLLKKWLHKCEDDSETSNWIACNTKECPKCQSTIEKNGGCNHMSCRKCQHQFCWLCLGPWSEHGSRYYDCNRYDESSSVEARTSQSSSRKQLQRYLHYFDRYANHGQSARLEKELIQKTEKKMDELQKSSSLSWIEVQFYQKAVEVLVNCRMTLKYTYAFAFYLERNNMTELFEDNQRDLELAVENLSELVEKPIDFENIPALKQAVLDKTVYVNTRRHVLLSDTAKGLLEDRWSYLPDSETNSVMKK